MSSVLCLDIDGSRAVKGEIKTISIGGGNSEYASVPMLKHQTGCEVQSYWSGTLRMDPDFVPLIGLHKIVSGHSGYDGHGMLVES